jgi:hypothetical protein
MLHIAFSLVLMAAGANSGVFELTRIDGAKVEGTLAGWNARGVTVVTEGTTQQVDARELLALRSLADASQAQAQPSPAVELLDASRLHFTKIAVGSGEAFVTIPETQKPTQIPTSVISRIDFRSPSEALSQAWDRVATSDATGDVVMIAKGEDAFDHLVGIVVSVTDDQVLFEWSGDRVPIKRSKVVGIAFYHNEAAQLRDPQCIVTTNDGRTIAAQSVSVNGNGLRIKTPTSITVDVPFDRLASADFSAGKLTCLSDIKPESSSWSPRVALPNAATIVSEFGAHRSNINFSGSALTLAWPNEALAAGREIRTYANGLALRSRSELTFRLPAGMKRFTATAGIDPATTEQGHVVLEIRADDRVVWEGDIDGKLPPVAIDVELKSARRLQILVDYGRNLDYGDRLNLVEARVTK